MEVACSHCLWQTHIEKILRQVDGIPLLMVGWVGSKAGGLAAAVPHCTLHSSCA
jgi:hypothetical protein